MQSQDLRARYSDALIERIEVCQYPSKQLTDRFEAPVDARVVVASVDTYLRFAEAVNRLDLTAVGDHTTLPQMVSGEWREDGSSDSSDESRGRRGSKEKSEGRGELDSGSRSRGEDDEN